MPTPVLISIGRGPISNLLEQWWVTIDLRHEELPAENSVVRARLSVQWDPWSNKFSIDHAESRIISTNGFPPRITIAEILDVYRNSSAESVAIEHIKHRAQKFHEIFPERTELMLHPR